jgi:diadenosine tetraphosphate (Ap4A) HIT family hydrolase
VSSATTCPACDIVAGRRAVPGGIVFSEGGLVLHALDGPSPIPGWVVLNAERHCRAIHDLDDEAAAALGPLARRVARALREALGAEHVYLFAIGDLLHHFHLHLVPRYADTPARLRGRGAFEAAPGDTLPDSAVEAAAARVAAALRG